MPGIQEVPDIQGRYQVFKESNRFTSEIPNQVYRWVNMVLGQHYSVLLQNAVHGYKKACMLVCSSEIDMYTIN